MCLAIGCPHPDHLLELLDLDQWRDWIAYYDIEPWGETRADQRQMALLGWLFSPFGNSPPPQAEYPYFEHEAFDAEAASQQLAEHQQRIRDELAEWENERARRNGNGH